MAAVAVREVGARRDEAGELAAVLARVAALEVKPAPAYMLVGDPDAPAIGTSTTALHTHQIRAAVVPKV